MTKKIILVLLIVALTAGTAFAQLEFSAGLGGLFRANFSGAVLASDGKTLVDLGALEKDQYDSTMIGGGFFVYFDATYVSLSLGMGFHDMSPANKDTKQLMKDMQMSQTLTSLDIGILGKFPIDLGAFTLFPVLGVDFRIAVAYDVTMFGIKLSYSDMAGPDDPTVAEEYTTIMFKLGVGADIPLGTSFYLRPMFVYGISTLPKAAQKGDDRTNDMSSPLKIIDSRVNHGLDFSLSVGYKF